MRNGRVLEAVLNKELGPLFFANRVSGANGGFIESAEHYKVIHLSVNCGVSRPFGEQSLEFMAVEALFAQAVPFVDGSTLTVESHDRRTLYYTIDLTPVTPEGWVVRSQRLNDRKPNSFGITISQLGYEQETEGAHQFTNEDFRAAGTEQCPSMGSGHFHPEGSRCERETGHLGSHEAIDEDGTFHYWEVEGALNSDPNGLFGFKNSCPLCGFVTAGGKRGDNKCSKCSYWLMQLEHPGAFVINGRHYRPGKGGFGGRTFTIQRSDGSTWKGELFTQGEVPSWMRNLFPDNGAFV